MRPARRWITGRQIHMSADPADRERYYVEEVPQCPDAWPRTSPRPGVKIAGTKSNGSARLPMSRAPTQDAHPSGGAPFPGRRRRMENHPSVADGSPPADSRQVRGRGTRPHRPAHGSASDREHRRRGHCGADREDAKRRPSSVDDPRHARRLLAHVRLCRPAGPHRRKPGRRARGGERPRVERRDKRVLSSEEIASLLEHALDTYRPLLATAAYTGLRPSS